MPKYKKHADGLCKTTVSTKKYDDDGNLIVIPLSARTSRELEEKVGEVKTRLKLGIYANDGKMTLERYAWHWYETYHKPKGGKSAEKYHGIIKNHLVDLYDKRLSEITKSDIQQLINAQEGHPDTQRMIKITMNQIIECAIDDELLYKNVCRKIKLPAQDTISSRRPLTDREKAVITALKNQHEFTDMELLYIDTLFVSGLRPEEALALTYSDVQNCVIDVNKALTWTGGKSIKSPKSKAGFRRIDVPQWYQDEVTTYHKTHHSIYIFTGKNGDLISQSTYRRFWNGIYNKINMKMGGTPKLMKGNRVIDAGIAATDLTPYIFRHNYCTMLYYLKIDVKEAARIMGHSNVRVTLEIYTHLDSLKSTTQDKISTIAL